MPPKKAAKSTEVVNVSLRVDPALHDRLRKLSFDKREPMTGLITRAIEAMLKAEKY